MYDSRTSWIIGFNGCERVVGEKVLAGKEHLRMSANEYDWLGSGIYFWEHNYDRALEFATHGTNRRSTRKRREPFVLGAMIDLKNCLNFLQGDKLKLLELGYDYVLTSCQDAGKSLPENKSTKYRSDKPLRFLDYAVIESIHQVREIEGHPPFDSVRGAFWEGKQPYPNAGFRDQDHIQICVRNPSCIKAYFRPLEKKRRSRQRK